MTTHIYNFGPLVVLRLETPIIRHDSADETNFNQLKASNPNHDHFKSKILV